MIDNADHASAQSDEDITAFDAAAYIFELSGELSRMAHAAGFIELRQLLTLARERAAAEMIKAGRAAQAKSKES